MRWAEEPPPHALPSPSPRSPAHTRAIMRIAATCFISDGRSSLARPPAQAWRLEKHAGADGLESDDLFLRPHTERILSHKSESSVSRCGATGRQASPNYNTA